MDITTTNYKFYMHVCRNPSGHSLDEVRTARLYICDHAEAMDKLVSKSTREIESLHQQLHDADESMIAVERALQDVDYRGSYADGVKYLKRQLTAVAKERDEIAAQARMLDRMVDERDEQLAAAESKIDTLTKELEIQSYWGPRWEETHTALMAALAACEAKDKRIALAIEFYNEPAFDVSEVLQTALAINPDASILKAHDEALIERIKAQKSGMTVMDIQDDDSLRFVQRVLESDAPETDRQCAIAMIVDIRTRVRKEIEK